MKQERSQTVWVAVVIPLELLVLQPQWGKIADTPGFSSLDYEVSTAEDLNQAFPEIVSVSRDCKFRTCTHTHEPSCAVKPAVEEGIIASFRFDNYLQFLSEIENRRETYKKSAKIPK